MRHFAGVSRETRNTKPTVLAEDRILVGDCIAAMQSLEPGSIDCVFADPPYNLQLGGDLHRPNNSRVDGVDEDWDRFENIGAYDTFTREWLSAAAQALKADGTIWTIGSYHNIFRVGAILQDLGFWILNDVIWRKTNPMPNFRGTRFTNAHETLIWAAKSPNARYTFNYEAMKNLNEDLQMRSDWLLPVCSGSERMKTDEGSKAHPTQKPESLLYRVILASTRPGETVMDPFFGTGTTGAVARKTGRRFVGIERDEAYAAVARRRIEAITEPADLTLYQTSARRQAPRVPFGSVVERGLIRPGTVVMDQRRRFTARVKADGTLISVSEYGHHKGSIHQVGAALQQAPSCNGWTFWHVEDADGSLLAIDVYRQQVRSELGVLAS